jgi:hypothetical protein
MDFLQQKLGNDVYNYMLTFCYEVKFQNNEHTIDKIKKEIEERLTNIPNFDYSTKHTNELKVGDIIQNHIKTTIYKIIRKTRKKYYMRPLLETEALKPYIDDGCKAENTIYGKYNDIFGPIASMKSGEMALRLKDNVKYFYTSTLTCCD